MNKTSTAVILSSLISGESVNINRNEYGKFTESKCPIELVSQEENIGAGIAEKKVARIAPLLSGMKIDSQTGEIAFLSAADMYDFYVENKRENTGEKIIILPDDRVQIVSTKTWPWSVQGVLLSTFPNGKTVLGSGTIVNRHHVLTAAHNIYRSKLGGWAIGCKFIPGYNVSNGITESDKTPFGEADAARLISVKGWTEENKKEYDYGMIILDREIGEYTGWFGVAYVTKNILLQHVVNISGYPASHGGCSLYTHHEKITSVSDQQVGYPVDTSVGQSGAAVWVYKSPYVSHPCAVGVHNYGDVQLYKENISTRINEEIFDNLVQWMQQW